jgi:hypothetical protein
MNASALNATSHKAKVVGAVASTFIMVGLGAGVVASISSIASKRSAITTTARRSGGTALATRAPLTSTPTTMPLSSSDPTALYAGASGRAGTQSDGITPLTNTIRSKSPTVSVPTTVLPDVASCQLSNFVASATSDHKSYMQGEPVTILATVTNTGPACTTDEAEGFVCIGADVEDASGTLVWTVWAPPTTGCAASSGPTSVLPTGWTQQAVWTWSQEECTSHMTNCSGQPVASGQYQVFGDNWDHLSSPVWITIESPPQATTTTSGA